jgi:hypothetical protein
VRTGEASLILEMADVDSVRLVPDLRVPARG